MRSDYSWVKGPRLLLEAQSTDEDGAVFVMEDKDKLHIVVHEEHAIDSYNETISCHLTATREQAVSLRDWLVKNFPE